MADEDATAMFTFRNNAAENAEEIARALQDTVSAIQGAAREAGGSTVPFNFGDQIIREAQRAAEEVRTTLGRALSPENLQNAMSVKDVNNMMGSTALGALTDVQRRIDDIFGQLGPAARAQVAQSIDLNGLMQEVSQIILAEARGAYATIRSELDAGLRSQLPVPSRLRDTVENRIGRADLLLGGAAVQRSEALLDKEGEPKPAQTLAAEKRAADIRAKLARAEAEKNDKEEAERLRAEGLEQRRRETGLLNDDPNFTKIKSSQYHRLGEDPDTALYFGKATQDGEQYYQMLNGVESQLIALASAQNAYRKEVDDAADAARRAAEAEQKRLEAEAEAARVAAEAEAARQAGIRSRRSDTERIENASNVKPIKGTQFRRLGDDPDTALYFAKATQDGEQYWRVLNGVEGQLVALSAAQTAFRKEVDETAEAARRVQEAEEKQRQEQAAAAEAERVRQQGMRGRREETRGLNRDLLGDDPNVKPIRGSGYYRVGEDPATANYFVKARQDGEEFYQLLNGIESRLVSLGQAERAFTAEIAANERTAEAAAARSARQAEREANRRQPPRGFVEGVTRGAFGSGFNGDGPLDRGRIMGNLGQTVGSAARYSLAYGGFYQFINATREGLAIFQDYQDSFTDYQVALGGANEVTQDTTNGLMELSRVLGENVGAAYDAAARGVRAFASGQDDATQKIAAFATASAAQKVSVIANKSLTDATGDVVAVGSAYDMSATQTELLLPDALANAKRNIGGDPAQIAQGLSSFAVTAKEAGYSLQEAANLIALVQSSTDESGQAVSTRLSRIIQITTGSTGRSLAANVNRGLGENVVDVNATAKEQLEQYGQAYVKAAKRRLPGIQALIRSQLGGTSNLRELIPILDESGQHRLAEALKKSLPGAGTSEYDRKIQNLIGTLNKLRGSIQDIVVLAANADLFAPFAIAVKAAEPLLHLMENLLKLYEKVEGFPGKVAKGIPGSGLVGPVGTTAIEAVLGYKAFQYAKKSTLAGELAQTSGVTGALVRTAGVPVPVPVPAGGAGAAAAATARAEAAAATAAAANEAAAATAAAAASARTASVEATARAGTQSGSLSERLANTRANPAAAAEAEAAAATAATANAAAQTAAAAATEANAVAEAAAAEAAALNAAANTANTETTVLNTTAEGENTLIVNENNVAQSRLAQVSNAASAALARFSAAMAGNEVIQARNARLAAAAPASGGNVKALVAVLISALLLQEVKTKADQADAFNISRADLMSTAGGKKPFNEPGKLATSKALNTSADALDTLSANQKLQDGWLDKLQRFVGQSDSERTKADAKAVREIARGVASEERLTAAYRKTSIFGDAAAHTADNLSEAFAGLTEQGLNAHQRLTHYFDALMTPPADNLASYETPKAYAANLLTNANRAFQKIPLENKDKYGPGGFVPDWGILPGQKISEEDVRARMSKGFNESKAYTSLVKSIKAAGKGLDEKSVLEAYDKAFDAGFSDSDFGTRSPLSGKEEMVRKQFLAEVKKSIIVWEHQKNALQPLTPAELDAFMSAAQAASAEVDPTDPTAPARQARENYLRLQARVNATGTGANAKKRAMDLFNKKLTGNEDGTYLDELFTGKMRENAGNAARHQFGQEKVAARLLRHMMRDEAVKEAEDHRLAVEAALGDGVSDASKQHTRIKAAKISFRRAGADVALLEGLMESMDRATVKAVAGFRKTALDVARIAMEKQQQMLDEAKAMLNDGMALGEGEHGGGKGGGADFRNHGVNSDKVEKLQRGATESAKQFKRRKQLYDKYQEAYERAAIPDETFPEATKDDAKDKLTAWQRRALRAQAMTDPDRTVATARTGLEVARANLAAVKDKQSSEYFSALGAVTQAQDGLAKALATASTAAAEANAARLGGSLAPARVQIMQARAQMAATARGTVGWFQALGQFYQGQQAMRDAVVQYRNNLDTLRGDSTDPVEQARDALRAARRKLFSDRGMGKDVRAEDRVAVDSTRNELANAKFQQRMSDMQTANDLGRISFAKYMDYLDHEHDRLTKIHHRTRQQQDQLDAVDKAMKDALNSMDSQFNLGDINTNGIVYQVRRFAAEQRANTSSQQYIGGAQSVQQTVTIAINGADVAKVKSIVDTYLNISGGQTRTLTRRKV